MNGEAAEPAASRALERPSEGVSSHARALEAVLPGLGAAVLVAGLGLAHGGYFATAWGPLTLAFLVVAGVALVVPPRSALGFRELSLPALLAVFVLWALGSASWGTPTEAVPEAQRALAYAAGALAFALVLRQRRVAGFLIGLWAGVCIVCVDALAGRLFPERFGEYDPIGVYRLSEPVGYWNALGVLAAFGVLLALSLAARSESLLVRLTAAGSTVPLALTLYFTFSRGAWLALLAGLVVALALDPRRLQLTVTLLVVAPWPALAVWLASRSGPLTETGHTLASASSDGRALAATAVGLTLFSAGAAALATGVAPRVHVSPRAATAGNVALAAGLGAAFVLAVAALGGPSSIWRSFSVPPVARAGNLNDRLFDLSGSGRADGWRVAVDVARDHPVFGSGGGSYKRYWLAERPYQGSIRDAHSLYVESLAEYGPLGLALVAAILGVPLGVAVRYRRRSLVPAAAGVLAIYAVHAGVDWDWEFPVLTLVALAAAAAVLASGDDRGSARELGWRRAILLAALIALVPIAAIGALGARAEAASADAAADRDYARAVTEARRAEDLAPWSVQPLLLLGRAQARSGARATAAATFARATRRDPGNWRSWYELAAVSRGPERAAALRRARALNPRERLLDELEAGA
jgi:O-antigen ligase/polysaccharide polymerase Wzy-like membrane protein